MKTALFPVVLIGLLGLLPLSAQVRKDEHKVGIDRDPDVVHLADYVKDPIVLQVPAPAVVFSDKAGSTKLGTLQANQSVVLEAMTDKAYKVRGKGASNGIAGWVGPKSFTSSDPDFVEHLKQFYRRQIDVAALISQQKVAVGMTPDEVAQSLGKPTKTETKQTASGTTGRWEYITYEDVPQFALVRDPVSGQLFRQVVGTTREVKSKTAVDFQGGVVSALEESEQKHGSPGKIIVPPIVLGW
jgi:outer membrane protein assembly factor BamE (lipoprotein component of BamABCDE complex)